MCELNEEREQRRFEQFDINIRNVNVFLTNATVANVLVSRTCPCVFQYLYCVFPSRAEYKQVDRLRKDAHARALGSVTDAT